MGYYSNYRPQSFLAAFRGIICVMKWRFPAAANKPSQTFFCKWQDILNGVIKLGSIRWLCICLDLEDSLFQSRKWLRAACYLKNPQTLSKMINNAKKKLKLSPQLFHPSVTAPPLQVLLYTEAEDKGLLDLWTCVLWWSKRKILLKAAFIYKHWAASQNNEYSWKASKHTVTPKRCSSLHLATLWSL